MFDLIRESRLSINSRGGSQVRLVRHLLGDRRGALLVESVLVMLVFSLVGIAVLGGVSTTHITGARAEHQSTSENIARNQIEYIFSLPYREPPSSYPTISVPDGYGVTGEAETYLTGDSDIQMVVVAVTFEGREDFVLETLRAK